MRLPLSCIDCSRGAAAGSFALFRSAMNYTNTLALGLVLAGTLHTPPADALVGGTIDPNASTSEWAGVVSITKTGGGVYSGALLDPYHVLTAAHVAAGSASQPGNLTINVNVGGDRSQQIVASQVFVHPDYTKGNLNAANDGQFAWNDDIAVIRLSSPVDGNVPNYQLLTTTPGLGSVFTMVTYGSYGDGLSPTLINGPDAAVKRIGGNRIGALYPADDEGSGAPNYSEVFAFSFSAPGSSDQLANEAGYAGGDSGSPIFVYTDGAWHIAGVGAFAGTPANFPGNSNQFGAIGGGMLIAPYASWIQAQMAAPVPEPRTYALMLAGLGLAAVAARYRRRRS